MRLLHSEEKEPVNLGNPREMTILEFAEAVKAAVGSLVPITFKPLPVDDPKQRRPDIGKAKRVLANWEPKVALEEGLRRTVEYFRKKVGKS
jgi:dTDP-glucose 4,6-dehydratase